jgi:hypothetical protein
MSYENGVIIYEIPFGKQSLPENEFIDFKGLKIVRPESLNVNNTVTAIEFIIEGLVFSIKNFQVRFPVDSTKRVNVHFYCYFGCKIRIEKEYSCSLTPG